MAQRRNTELMLMLAAVPALFLLFLTANIQGNQGITFASFAVPLGLLVAFGAAHGVERLYAKNADPAILPIAFLLSGIGICFVQRLAPELALKQTIWLFVSVGALIATLILVRSVKSLSRYKYTMMLAGIILLLLPALIGVEIYGSKIWLSFGGFSFQPSEIAKILIILFLASYLADNREMLSITRRRALGISTPDFKTLLPMIVMWFISLLIVVFEHDLGSALFFFGVFMVMLFVTTGRWFYVVLGVGLVALGAVGAYFALAYVKARFDIWIDPFAFADTSGYQLVQALYSLADGGLFGTGVGRGYPTLIPVVESDFIFVAMAEEMGLLGSSGILILYILFAIRGFATAARCKSDIDAIAAVGLTTAITLQAFVIVGGTIGVIPLTGVTLPFMSQGGSSLLSSFIILGLLLRSGDDGTGLEKELVGTSNLGGGILGRVSLGKRLTVVTAFLTILFALLIARLTYVMVVQADELQTLPNNNHTILREATREKGSILTSDGVILAESRDNGNGTYSRVYPQGSLAAQVLGYTSERYGASGVEASQSDILTGHKNFATISDAIRSAAGSEVAGNDVVLTIDSRIQAACENALSGYVGAAVVLDAETGAVVAMASSPTYDVNQAETLLDAAQEGGGGSALLNRATGSLYAPGSTFKVVTLVSALENGKASPTSTYNGDSPQTIGNGKVTNYDNVSYGTVTLEKALAYSINTVFGQLAVEVGAENLVKTAENFGFDQEVGQDFDALVSLMPNPIEMTTWETAWAGDGQPVGEHESPAGPQATVIQMAMVAAGIANGGTIMNPFIIQGTLDRSGAVLSATSSRKFATVDSPETNATVTSMMEAVVNEGTATETIISGVKVAGKTGTAQTDKEMDDAWFIGFTEVDGARFAIAIVTEQSGSGAATPLARSILQTALATRGVI